MMIPYSTQALKLKEQLKEFNEQEFEQWWIKNKMIIGTLHLIEYLDTKGDKL